MSLTVTTAPNYTGTLAVGDGSTAQLYGDGSLQGTGTQSAPSTTESATTGGATGGASVKSPAQIQAEADEAEKGTRRTNARNNIQTAIALYEAIFGDIDALAKERLETLEGDYAGRVNDLTGEYLEGIPTIQGNYAAIGNDSSTFQDRALGKAKSGFEKGLGDIGKAKGEDIAKVGSFVSTNKAKYTADKDSLTNMGNSLDQVTDIGQLREADTNTFNKNATLQADRSGFMTDAGLKGQLAAITNGGEAYGNILAGVKNIMGSAATTSMKGAAATMLIKNSGLSPEQQAQLIAEAGSLATPVKEEEEQQVIA